MLKKQILELRKQKLSYQQIADKLQCSKSTVCYYCGENQKEKSNRRLIKRRSKQHPYQRKLDRFLRGSKAQKLNKSNKSKLRPLLKAKIECFTYRNEYVMPKFTVDDVINKMGEDPRCYLTGDPIDINKTKSYHFDHIIPRSRGGTNDIDNLGICTKQANQSKNDMTPDELINLCKKILVHNGYNIAKN